MVSRVIPVDPFDLVIFGGTGDLARRKILPALGGLDLSPIFAFIAIRLFDMLVIANRIDVGGMLEWERPWCDWDATP